jgi:hypothetical protein
MGNGQDLQDYAGLKRKEWFHSSSGNPVDPVNPV